MALLFKLSIVKLLVFIILKLFLFTGCVPDASEKVPNTPSKILNEFVRSSTIQHLDLESLPVNQINLEKNNIIYSTYDQGQSQKIGRLKELTYFNDNLYVYDSFQSAVFKILKNGIVEGPLTTQGKGPGEHLVVTSMQSNSKYIYLPDWNNARINIYSDDMNTEDVVTEFNGVARTNYIEVNDEIMLFSNPNKMGFISESPKEGLISISYISNLGVSYTTILPQIIPDGYQPQVYNTPNFSLNRKNEIAASYAPLPWIFLFDEETNLKVTLILKYSGFEQMNIPKMDFFEPIGNEGYGGDMPLKKYQLLDNGDLFISTQKQLFHISLGTDDSYHLVGRYQFKTSDESESSIGISGVFPTETNGEFYAFNWDYLFKFNLRELNDF